MLVSKIRVRDGMVVYDDFKESEHPRDKSGKFMKKGTGGNKSGSGELSGAGGR